MNELDSIRFLRQTNIKYDVKDIASFSNLEEAAKLLKLNVVQVIKTLIVKGKSGKFYICLIGGNHQLHTKKIKRLLDEDDIKLAPIDEILEQTGFNVGAVPPFALKQKFVTLIEESLKEYEVLAVGAGKKGVEILLSPDNLILATEGKFESIVKVRP